MKKRQKMLILAVCVLLFLLTACSAGNASAPDRLTTPAAAPSESTSALANEAAADYYAGEAAGVPTMAVDGSAVPDITVLPGGAIQRGPDLKLIRTAYLTMETENFDKAQLSLDTLVLKYGGYYESAEIRGGAFSKSGGELEREMRYGAYTVRVPSAYFSEFLAESGEVALVTSLNQSAQDVSEQYFDLETRLKTLRTKQERINMLLAKAEKMEEIIYLENTLSEVAYQIETYTSTLQKLSSQVDYASIRINLDEVAAEGEKKTEDGPFLDRLKDAFTGGFGTFFSILGSVIVALVYLLPLLILAGIGLFIFFAVRRRRKAKDNSSQGGGEPPENL